MNKRVCRIAAAGVLLAVLVGIMLPAASVSAGGNISPRAMLRTYYDAINRRDYGAAYVQWLNPIQTYENFAAGYATTTRVDAYFGGFQPNGVSSIEGGVPTVLVGYHSDGTVVAFNGCYNVVYNDLGTGMAQWWISGASMQPLSSVPSAQNVQQYLNVYCYPRTSAAYYDTVQQVLIDYYDAVNRADYWTAYNLWVYPLQTYNNFVAGYADTTDVVMFYGNTQFNGYYNPYDAGRVPVVLFGYHTDGSMVAYQGCIILGFDAVQPVWRISGSTVRQMPYTTTPGDTTIQGALGAACYGF